MFSLCGCSVILSAGIHSLAMTKNSILLPALQKNPLPRQQDTVGEFLWGDFCYRAFSLNHALGDHGLWYFLKTGDIGACHIVAFLAVALCSVIQVMENINHDSLQLAVHFFKAPA